MAQEKIVIQFQAKGNKALTDAIKALDNATRQLTRRQKKFGEGLNDVRNKSRGLNVAFATLRSKMLLFSFAMSLGGRQLIRFSKDAAQLEGVSTAFNTLQGGTDKSTVAIEKLKVATNGTMSSMDLLKQANNAMVLGITKNSDEMARMFDLAQRLGRALGVDTTHAVESLITGIGRQSRLMLDNIGIIVKSEEAYERYAAGLNKSSKDLTDSEKKQAFLNATLEAAESKVAELGAETLTAADSWSRFGANVANVAVQVGDAINTVLIPEINALSAAMEGDLDPDIALVTNNLTFLTKAIEQQAIKLKELQFSSERFGSTSKGFFGFLFRDITLEQRLQAQIDLIAKLDARFNDLAVSNESSEEIVTGIGESIDSGLIPSITFLTDAYEKSTKGQIAFLEAQIELALALADVNELTIEEAEGLVALQNTLESLRKKGVEPLTSEQRNLISFTTRLSDALFQAALGSDSMAESFSKALTAMAAQLASKAATFALLSMFSPATASSIGFSKFVFGHTGGLIKNDGNIQRFAKGGAVNGEDNVPIMAQGGEFIMSRRAVDAVGVETMNRINKTGSAGNINVNVSGNVMTQDFVEGELAVAIKKAARRGSDFGLS